MHNEQWELTHTRKGMPVMAGDPEAALQLTPAADGHHSRGKVVAYVHSVTPLLMLLHCCFFLTAEGAARGGRGSSH
jgi:hypothetical protein